MMTNLLNGAHVANKLFSTIARFRLLLVMFVTLTVTTNALGAEVTFTTTSSGGFYSNSKTIEPITITFNKGTGNNLSWQSGHLRFYQNNTVTITCTTGYNITAVTITGLTGRDNASLTNFSANDAKTEYTWSGSSNTITSTNNGSEQARLTSIKVTYTSSTPAVTHKAYFYNGTTLLNTGGTEFAEGATVSYTGTTPESCDNESETFVGWATGTWSGKLAKGDINPDFYNIIDGEDLPEMGTADVNYYAVFAKEATTSGGTTTTTFTAGTDNIATGKNGIKFTMSNTTGSGGYYQVYSGTAMTISSNNPITSFIMTCTKSGTEKYGPGNIDFKTGSYSYSGTNGTWTGNSTSIKSYDSSAQLRITEIVVTTSGGTTTTYSDYITTCTTQTSH